MISRQQRTSLLHCIIFCSCLCGCGDRGLDTHWMGDAESVGATVWVDGKQIAVLSQLVIRDYPFIAPPGLVAGCYAHGDTIARGGEPRLAQHIMLPRGEHEVVVIGIRLDTLMCRAVVWDSPNFTVYSKCGLLLYPGREGEAIATLRTLRADTPRRLSAGTTQYE